jgi:hypothetical protein
MYTRVNDIMQLDRGPGSSLDEGLLAVCLKVLILDQFLAELMTPPAACEPISMNQAARTTLLTAMLMLDDVDITAMQRVTYPAAWRFPGPTSPAAWVVLSAVVVVLSLVAEAVAQQVAV